MREGIVEEQVTRRSLRKRHRNSIGIYRRWGKSETNCNFLGRNAVQSGVASIFRVTFNKKTGTLNPVFLLILR
jgi:hypothetical protein